MNRYFDRKEKIFYWLKGHPNLHYIVHVVRRFGDKQFYQLLFDEGYPGLIKVENYGDSNKDLEIFLINVIGNKIGLPCFIRYTLLALYEVQNLNFTNVIRFIDKSGWLQENCVINDTNNIFEYYYNQPSFIGVDQVYKSHHVFSCNCVSLLMRANKDLGCYQENGLLATYNVTESYIDIMGDIYKRYLRLNKITHDSINKDKRKLFGNSNDKILGVHLRGTDFELNYKNHPKAVTIEQFENVIDSALISGNFSKIFIATDDIIKLDYLNKKYPNRILFYEDTYRDKGKKNILSINTDQRYSKYSKGLDVLRDIYTLAACDGLIAGLSHVSILTRIVKKSLNRSYEYQVILSNGIN